MSSANQFLVTVNEVSGFFATKQGGNASVTVTKDFDGGSDTPDLSNSRTVYDDLTVGRRYDITRDAAIVIAERKKIGRDRTVTVQPCDANFVPTGPKTTYLGRLSKVTESDVDANTGTPARWAMVFAVQKVL